MKVQPIYNNKFFKKGLEFAADNSALFIAGTSLALSAVVRPLSILAAPKADKENKKLACAKSVSSSLIGYMLMLGVSLPVARGVKRIDNQPTRYLKAKTIENLKENGKTLQESSAYQLATQMFKLGLGFIVAAPKAFLTSALIPTVMDKMFPTRLKSERIQKQQQVSNVSGENISFKGRAGVALSEGMGKVLDTSFVQKFANRFKDSNFVMHTVALTDTLATLAFIHHAGQNPDIDESRKKVLNYNAAISTGLCISGGYVLDKALDKPTQTFVKKFTEANKNSPKLHKYLEGIKIVKPALIFGAIYYGIIPFVSTFLADRFDEKRSV